MSEPRLCDSTQRKEPSAALREILNRAIQRLAAFDLLPKGAREICEPLERTLANIVEIAEAASHAAPKEPSPDHSAEMGAIEDALEDAFSTYEPSRYSITELAHVITPRLWHHGLRHPERALTNAQVGAKYLKEVEVRRKWLFGESGEPSEAMIEAYIQAAMKCEFHGGAERGFYCVAHIREGLRAALAT